MPHHPCSPFCACPCMCITRRQAKPANCVFFAMCCSWLPCGGAAEGSTGGQRGNAQVRCRAGGLATRYVDSRCMRSRVCRMALQRRLPRQSGNKIGERQAASQHAQQAASTAGCQALKQHDSQLPRMAARQAGRAVVQSVRQRSCALQGRQLAR
jgi:hypothetical protein